MDPSLTITSDPHHPPQLTPFPTFLSGASPNFSPFGVPGSVNPLNNHVFPTQPSPPQPPANPTPPHPNHRPYPEMICTAIAALNETDGSSKMAISRYIERSFTGLPPAHGALLTHHLKTLKNSGVLALVKKSYKFASSYSRPESVAAGVEVPRSEIPNVNAVVNNGQSPVNPVAVVTGSASQSQKRGRGRPPKAKPEAQQPQAGDSSKPLSSEQFESAVTKPAEEVQELSKRRPGRPRKDGSVAPVVQASVMAGIMKRRGRPPGRRAAGRQRKPKSVSSSASVFPYVANGARRRGRPRRIDAGGVVAPTGGEIVAVAAPGMKRGRGRPPKIGGVISRLMKPKRGRGRPVGRPRKALLIAGATGTQDPNYGELKKKFDVFKEKAKEIVNVLKGAGVSDNQAVVQAILELEWLIAMETVEPPQAMEEVPPVEEAAAAAPPPETELQAEAETEGEELGQERGGGEEGQNQTEAEAMQEALF